MSMHAVREALDHAGDLVRAEDETTKRYRRQELQQTVRSLKRADRVRLLEVIAELVKALGAEKEES